MSVEIVFRVCLDDECMNEKLESGTGRHLRALYRELRKKNVDFPRLDGQPHTYHISESGWVEAMRTQLPLLGLRLPHLIFHVVAQSGSQVVLYRVNGNDSVIWGTLVNPMSRVRLGCFTLRSCISVEGARNNITNFFQDEPTIIMRRLVHHLYYIPEGNFILSKPPLDPQEAHSIIGILQDHTFKATLGPHEIEHAISMGFNVRSPTPEDMGALKFLPNLCIDESPKADEEAKERKKQRPRSFSTKLPRTHPTKPHLTPRRAHSSKSLDAMKNSGKEGSCSHNVCGKE